MTLGEPVGISVVIERANREAHLLAEQEKEAPMKCIGTKQIVWFVGAVLVSTGFDRAADAMIFTLENQSDVVIQRVQAEPDYDRVQAGPDEG